MSRAVLIAALVATAFCAAFNGMLAGAAPLPPFLNPAIEVLPFAGRAYGVDGNRVVGSASGGYAGSVGFLYDGKTFTDIRPPGGGDIVAFGISGNKIVGAYGDSSGTHAFVYDGSDYTPLDHPLAANTTIAADISGDKIVGWFYDTPYVGTNVPRGFLFDGTTWTTLDHPLGVRGTVARGIDGNNIVGTYTTSLGRTRGFLFDGTTWTTLDHPGSTVANDIEGGTIVGYTSFPSTSPFIYDGSTFEHPTLGLPNAVFTGISGNTMVGYYRDGPSGLDVPFIYTVPEPGSLTLGAMGGLLFLALALRARRRHGRSV